LHQVLAELETPWGPQALSVSGLSLAAAVMLGWYLSLALADGDTRRVSLAYASAWMAASIQLLVLHRLGAPALLMPVAAVSLAVGGVALMSPGARDLPDTLDRLSPALALALCLSAWSRPTVQFAPIFIVAVLGVALPQRGRSSGQAFLATCLVLVPLSLRLSF